MTPSIEDRVGDALGRLARCVEVTPPPVDTVTRLRHVTSLPRTSRWRLPTVAFGVAVAAASVALIVVHASPNGDQPAVRTSPGGPAIVTGPTSEPAATSLAPLPDGAVSTGDRLYVIDPAPPGTEGVDGASSPLDRWVSEHEASTKTFVRRGADGAFDGDIRIDVSKRGGTLDTCGRDAVDLAGTPAWLKAGQFATGRFDIRWPIDGGHVSVSTAGLDRAAALDAATSVAGSPFDDPVVPVGFQPVPEPVDGGTVSYMAPTPPSAEPAAPVTAFDADCNPVVIDGAATDGAGGISAEVMLTWSRYDEPVDLDREAFIAGGTGDSTTVTVGVAGVSARLVRVAGGWSTLIWSPEPGVVVTMHSAGTFSDPVALAGDVRRVPADQAPSFVGHSGPYDDVVEVARGEDELGRWGVHTGHDVDPNGAALMCIVARREGNGGGGGACKQPAVDGTLPVLCVRPTVGNGLIAGILPGTATEVDLTFESSPSRPATVVPIDGGTAWYSAGPDLPDMQGSAMAVVDGRSVPAC